MTHLDNLQNEISYYSDRARTHVTGGCLRMAKRTYRIAGMYTALYDLLTIDTPARLCDYFLNEFSEEIGWIAANNFKGYQNAFDHNDWTYGVDLNLSIDEPYCYKYDRTLVPEKIETKEFLIALAEVLYTSPTGNAV